jgi:hypothetical protein
MISATALALVAVPAVFLLLQRRLLDSQATEPADE